MNILLRYGNEVFISNAQSTISGQWNVETKYGLAATPLGIVHGLSPSWRKALNNVLRQNYGSQVAYNSSVPVSPEVDDHIQSFVIFSDNDIREIAVSHEFGTQKISFGQNGYYTKVRDRVLGPSEHGQVLFGHWQHYNGRVDKSNFDRMLSILAHACKTPEEFFRRFSYSGAPNLSSYHVFEIADLQRIAFELYHEHQSYQVVKDLAKAADGGKSGEEKYDRAVTDNQCLEIFLSTMHTKLQSFLDEKLKAVAGVFELAL